MTLKVYVAGSTMEMDRARFAMKSLKDIGIEVTSTWVDVVTGVGDPNPRAASAIDRFKWSEADLVEVKNANLIWFLVPGPNAPTRGAWLEVGYAHALGKPGVASGDTKSSIFLALFDEFTTDSEARVFIAKIAKRCNTPAPIQAPQLAALDLRPKIEAQTRAIEALTASEQARIVHGQTRILELADDLSLRPGTVINKSQLTPRYLEIEFEQAPNVFFTVKPSPLVHEPFTVMVDDYRGDQFRSLIPAHSTTFEGATKTLDTLLAGIRAKS
jgi:nucleoside 2-deoxyribosyltransferase